MLELRADVATGKVVDGRQVMSKEIAVISLRGEGNSFSGYKLITPFTKKGNPGALVLTRDGCKILGMAWG